MGPMDDMAELLLVFAARAQHISQLIRPALERGAWVLCDRFTDSTIAYQGFARQQPLDRILLLKDLVQADIEPDCTFLLEAPLELGMARARGRAQSTGTAIDRFETEQLAIFPWQDKIWADITHRHSTSGLPHAMLFAGLEGIGKHELALHTAKWLLCRSPGSSSACGQCHSCQLWDAGSHPDFLSCTPEDGSRQIRIEAIRRVNDFLAQTPQISQCQVVSLHPVEVMNPNAANALLKTLEEPAGESFLLLETERFGSVLPTIRSRCQRIVLNPPSAPESLSWLQQQG